MHIGLFLIFANMLVCKHAPQVAKATKHEQHVAVCVLKVLTLPGVTTAAELAAAAVAAGSNGGSAKKGKAAAVTAAAAAATAGSSKQGSIRSFFKPTAKPAAAAAAAGSSGGDGAKQQQQQQGGHIVELSEADVLAAGGVAHYLLVQRPSTGLLAGLWEFPGGCLVVSCVKAFVGQLCSCSVSSGCYGCSRMQCRPCSSDRMTLSCRPLCVFAAMCVQAHMICRSRQALD
jgi:hypothetical protein